MKELKDFVQFLNMEIIKLEKNMGHSATSDSARRALISVQEKFAPIVGKVRGLERFYNDVAEATLRHDAVEGSAVVHASKLELALVKVDPHWWNNYQLMMGEHCE